MQLLVRAVQTQATSAFQNVSRSLGHGSLMFLIYLLCPCHLLLHRLCSSSWLEVVQAGDPPQEVELAWQTSWGQGVMRAENSKATSTSWPVTLTE